jgi:hypothetical protein
MRPNRWPNDPGVLSREGLTTFVRVVLWCMPFANAAKILAAKRRIVEAVGPRDRR